jgi:hypothetical protein
MMVPSFAEALRILAPFSEEEMTYVESNCPVRTFKKGEWLCKAGYVADEVYYVSRGLIRVMVTDADGQDHTLHFALEGQFICDYSSYLLRKPVEYALQALEPLEVRVIPRYVIDWCYSDLRDGNQLGRLIAEYYFIYLDTRLKLSYLATPVQRYQLLSTTFPNIHNRVPQHMLASYLGITSVHLSRLKSQNL